MLHLTKRRDLHLAQPAVPGRHAHVSAASGLVTFGSRFYVVADDELHLGVFDGSDPGSMVRLFDGELPDETKARKKLKPDLEALVRLPAHGAFAHGALLGLGSGSTANRRRGALVALDGAGNLAGEPFVVDLSPLLDPLDAALSGLNIEGATISGNSFLLLQRGNTEGSSNAVVRFALSDVLDVLSAPRGLNPLAICPVVLEARDGVALGFTDAAALADGRIVFTAAAEDTDNAYDDGVCTGSAAGILDIAGNVLALHPIEGTHKIEGVDARVDRDAIRLLLVTDADDPERPASLFETTLPA
jgi:hypothetical protein